MRVRRVSPLLLLLAPCLLHAQSIPKQRGAPPDGTDVLSNEDILELNIGPENQERRDTRLNAAVGTTTQATAVADSTLSARTTQSTKGYRGTNDAPVDGLDGKPHAGPFVDTTPETTKSAQGSVSTTQTAKARPTSLEKFGDGVIPEKIDGVMNDENRKGPEKGKDGTAGGISEKEKERKVKAAAGENKPQGPNEAPPLPHVEQERVREEESKSQEKSKGSNKDNEKGAKPAESTTTTLRAAGAAAGGDGEYGVGGHGMEKPTDLPEKPHNIPHPEPKVAKELGGGSSSNSNSGPSPNLKDDSPSGRDAWLTDTMPYTEGQRPKPKNNPTTSTPNTSSSSLEEESWHEWFHSFVLSLTMILFSEIGDKTFLIAALMAMRHPRILVFSAAFGALIVMTVLSAVLGHTLPTLLPKRFTTFAAAILFLVFGAKMLREGMAMPRDLGVGEEMREVEAELEEKEHDMARRRRASSVAAAGASPFSLEAGRGRGSKGPSDRVSSPSPSRGGDDGAAGKQDRLAGLMNLLSLVLSPAWVQTFVMTFLGEWGDRSQIATIAMAAGQDYWWVTLGAITGHAFCTGLAVIGGRALAGRVSMRVVTIGGAVAFLAFGLIYLYECLTE